MPQDSWARTRVEAKVTFCTVVVALVTAVRIAVMVVTPVIVLVVAPVARCHK